MNLYESIIKEADTPNISKEEKKAFAEGIDLTPLFKKAEEFVGTKLKFEKEITEDRWNNSYFIEFQSGDMKDACGVFGKILQYCVVDNFSNAVVVDKETGKLRYWVQVHLSYKHKDGGMNGMKLFSAQFMDNEWEFF